ncbi:DEAD/DEAH box helicase [Rhodopseudomonas palustris]|uniref:DEAD/DEAH box helicase n=1 Tax=Rhodopseudomonas palustris TaxID=1076 RepID=UPI0021F36FC7|nr:DEAD/DEAH box helicase [Rhodopseudomonas palustris]
MATPSSISFTIAFGARVMALEAERLEVAETIRRELGQPNSLTSEQARLFVRCLQFSWQVPPIRWSERESREQLADARRLLHAAELFRELDGETSRSAVECYRRAGEIFEWLARADDPLKGLLPVALMAAGAYQLGELPAMAASVLRQGVISGQAGDLDFDLIANQPEPDEDLTGEVWERGAGIPEDIPEGGNGRLYSAFFQADFDETLRLAADFWALNPELTSRQGSAAILAEDAEDRVAWYLVVELVRAIGLASDALRRGDERRLLLARRKFVGLRTLAVRSTSEDIWTLISLLQATVERFASASLYPRIERMAAAAPAFVPRLRYFARDQFARGRGVLWTSQIQGLDRLAEASSFALCTPTGSGKTLVANLALIKELLIAERSALEPAPLALYLVPSRALAGEVEAKLTAELGRDLIITGLYGGADWGITDYWLTAEVSTVLIATVEKADALMRYLGPLLIGRLKLLIIDEAHQVVADDRPEELAKLADHSSRAMRLESLVSRILALKPEVIRIALTAVAGGAAAPVARWMEARADAAAVGVNYRSTRQLVGTLEASRGIPPRVQLDQMNGFPLYVRGREEAVYLPLRIPVMPELPAAVRASVDRFNQLHILWTALHLRNTGRRILISVPQEPEQTMRWFAECLVRPDWNELARFAEPDEPDLQGRYRQTVAACLDYCGDASYELALLRSGIATNHGQMPQRLRRLMTDLIDRRICAVTVATATLTEGVNLPFDMIFLTSLRRQTFNQITQRQVVSHLSTSEFRNLAGRAGRPGSAEGVEGMTLVALPQGPSATSPRQVALQRRQVERMNGDYDYLLHRLAAEAAPNAIVRSPLALLLRLIAQYLQQLYGIAPGEQMMTWLETTLPENITAEVGTSAQTEHALLADGLDELDAILLAANEELVRVMAAPLDGTSAETFLRNLWSRSFAQVAATQEAWLEQAFIHRGRSLVERIYPDAAQRRRLYQFGYAPTVGRRFEPVAPLIRAELASAAAYGTEPPAERLARFVRLGDLVRAYPGFGFRVRGTVGDQEILANWTEVLSWWLKVPGATSPRPLDLRAWQRFVADNLDFRLGVAIGAVVAEAWSAGAGGAQTPDLATWREKTQLPWFGFWIRELLRWGTLDPFVAFCLSQGLADTRESAERRRHEFDVFLTSARPVPTDEDYIDPQLFLSWQHQLPRRDLAAAASINLTAELVGADGSQGRYGVLPVTTAAGTTWYDAAGFLLARTQGHTLRRDSYRSDFELITDGAVRIERTFEWRGARS